MIKTLCHTSLGSCGTRLSIIVRFAPSLNNLAEFLLQSHEATEDDEYDGYFIPKGTIVVGNTW